jgi:hypothetical protein
MRQKEIDAKNVDAQLAKRGLYSSGIAIDAQNDLNERYIPQINAAASEASAQRYGLQSGENQGVNQFVLSNTGMLNEGDFQRAQSENQFNQTNDQQENAFNLNQSAAENAWRRANATDTNQFNLQKAAGQTQTSQAQAGAENTFNTDQAEKQYNAKWRPLDYLQGVWNGTGGSISSSTGGGWSV